MPISRNGNDTIQTMGKRIRASSATGQQSIKRIHQPIKRIRDFILSVFFAPSNTLIKLQKKNRAASGSGSI
jgi:hypothetical protein